MIVDTDVGSDDMMAIAFLLSQRNVHAEAITVVNGMAHVPAGARNVLRLLALAGRADVPVYMGRETPLSGNAEFPPDWRKNSDELPRVTLPATHRKPEPQPAAEFLAARLADARHPVQVLALGPLANLAEAFAKNPVAARAITRLVIMGGAVRVSGNLGDGGASKTNNTTAEWNIFVDPVAAAKVFSSGAKIFLVPLDATQKVPIDSAFAVQFQSHATTPLAHFVAQVLATDRDYIHDHIFYAWDPLAAAISVNPAIASFTPLRIAISDRPGERGRTREISGRSPNAQVALNANAAKFRAAFLPAFGIRRIAPARRRLVTHARLKQIFMRS